MIEVHEVERLEVVVTIDHLMANVRAGTHHMRRK